MPRDDALLLGDGSAAPPPLASFKKLVLRVFSPTVYWGMAYLVAMGIQLIRRMQHHEPRLLQADAALRQLVLQRALLAERAAERRASVQAAAHQLHGSLRHAHHAHAVVQPAGAQPALCDLEPAPFAQQNVARRHRHAAKVHLRVAVWRVVVPEPATRNFKKGVFSCAPKSHHPIK
jgi:hypothetical protein